MKKKEMGELKILSCNNHKGQFFLIAAVVIIVVIVSVVTISNYTTQKQTTKLYDLGKELGIESQNVIDYGTYNSQSSTQITTLMETFIQNYHDYQEQDKNIYFVFGNNTVVYTIGYQDAAKGEWACISLNPTCCSGGETCDTSSNTCKSGYGSCERNQVKCGTNCCNKGETCDVDSGTCKSGGVCNQGAQCSLCTPIVISSGAATASPVSISGATITKVSVTIGDNVYQFGLKPGENFYFVIWQQVGGERQVVTSDD